MAAVEDTWCGTRTALILLFTPPFDAGASNPGYIKGYVPGIRENGGQYTHAATWVVLATALLGRGDRARGAVRTCSTRSATPPLPRGVQRTKLSRTSSARMFMARRRTPAAAAGPGIRFCRPGCTESVWKRSLVSVCGARGSSSILHPARLAGYEITYRHRSATYQIRCRELGGSGRGVRSRVGRWTATGAGGRDRTAQTTADSTKSRLARVVTGRWQNHGNSRPPNDRDELNRLLTDEELGRLQLTTLQYYLHESQPGQRAGPRQDRPERPGQHRRRRHGAGDVPVVVERGVIFPRVRGRRSRSKRLRFFRDSPQGPEPDATGYKGFYYHFLDMRDRPPRLGVRAVHDRLGVPVRRHAHLPPPTSTATRRTRPRSAASPTRSTAGPTGTGRATAAPTAHPRLAAGDRLHPAPLDRVTTRGCCSTCSASARRRTRCRRRATPPTAPPTSGSRSTAASCSTPGRCSRTSSRTSGSTSAASRTPSCASTAATTSRTAGRRPTSSRSTRVRNPLRVRRLRRALLGVHGLRRPRLGQAGRSTGSSGSSSTTIARGAPFGPDDGTVAPWVVVASLPFAPEIVSRPSAHFARLDLGHDEAVRVQAVVQPDLRSRRTARPAGGSRPTTSGSTRARSS